MNFRIYIWSIFLGSLLCFFAWGSIIYLADPDQIGFIGFFLFYLALFMGILGLSSSLGLLVRWLILKDDHLPFRHTKKVFRQSLIVSLLIISALLLLQFHFLRWWNALILVMLGIVLEGMVYTNRTYSNQDYVR
jgi:hypothetical protein